MEKLGIKPNFRVCSGSRRSRLAKPCLGDFAFLSAAAAAFSGYRLYGCKIRPRNACSARIESESITIDLEPLFQYPLVNQIVDKNDMVASGIMPVAVAIFNDNGFAVNQLMPAIETFQSK